MIGEKLGNYTVMEVIGSGSMGTVYKAESPDGSPVALKLVRSRLLYSMERREHFLRCLLAAAEIRHKCICPILEIGDDNDDFFIVMPFLQGKTLHQYMKKQPVGFSRALDMAFSIGSALEAIHAAGYPHCGLKPANIWILDEGNRSLILTDCCIACLTDIAGFGKTGYFGLNVDFPDARIPLGALNYASPEQVRGEPVDHRTDIFTFGVVLYEMLSGHHPFEAHTVFSRIRAILEDDPAPLVLRRVSIHKSVETIIRKCLAKNREERYQSMSALLADMESVRKRAETEPDPISSRFGIREWLRARLRRPPTNRL